MLYPSINEIRKKADSRYTLVILAAKRARDLIDGKPALTEDSVDRPVSIAAHEIAEDLITYTRTDKAMDAAMEDESADKAEFSEEEETAEVITEAEEAEETAEEE